MSQLNIPDELKEKLDKIAGDSDEFSSTDDYVVYVLKQIVDKKLKSDNDSKESEVYSKEDEAKIKERLKNLGYLD